MQRACHLHPNPLSGFKKCVDIAPTSPAPSLLDENSLVVLSALLTLLIVGRWLPASARAIGYLVFGAAVYRVLEGWDVHDSVSVVARPPCHTACHSPSCCVAALPHYLSLTQLLRSCRAGLLHGGHLNNRRLW